MAGFVDRIKIIFDVENSAAARSIKSLRADVAATEGPFNKAKVAGRGMFDMLGVAGPQAALAAGAALAAFGAKAISEFNNAALEAGKFADATGLSSEEASRLIEVAGDLGVEVGTLEGAVRRVNGAAESGALAAFGVEIATTASGAYDANQTFLNTVDAIGRITSAAEREAAAKKLMGRSWAELAEMTTMSAEELRKALAAVSDQQVFDDDKVKKAREYRAAMDDLSDAGRRLTLAVGEGLVPALTSAAEATSAVIGPVMGLNEALDGALFNGPIMMAKDMADGYGTLDNVVRGLTGGMGDQEDAADDLAPAVDNVAASMDAATRSADALRDAQDDLRQSAISAADGARATEAAIDAYEDSVAELAGTMMSGTATAEDLETANRDTADAAIEAAKAFAEQEGASLDSAEGQQRFRQKLDELSSTALPEVRRQVDAYIERLNAIPANKTTTVTTVYQVVNPTASDELRGIDTDGDGVPNDQDNYPLDPTKRKGTVPGGKPAPGGTPAVMDANGLWRQALNAWGAFRQSSPTESKADKRRADFDRRFERARRKYERGMVDAVAYLAILQELRREFKWPKLSDRGMALWREIDRARKDIAEAAEEAAEGSTGGRPAPKSAPATTTKPGGGGGGGGRGVATVTTKPGGGRGRGGGRMPNGSVVIFGDNRALMEWVAKGLQRLERGQA